MTAGTQCDTCRTFSPPHPPGWFYLGQQPGADQAPPSLAAALFGNPSEPLTFCGIKCLAEFATARALVEEQPAGEEPS